MSSHILTILLLVPCLFGRYCDNEPETGSPAFFLAFVNVTNVYGQPDIGEISGETTPYQEIELYTDFGPRNGDLTSSVGVGGVSTPRGYRIGFARARTMEFKSGTQGNADAIYKLFLFDIRMLTFLRLNKVKDYLPRKNLPVLLVNPVRRFSFNIMANCIYCSSCDRS